MADEEATIPVYWNWNYNRPIGEAVLTPDGAIKIRLRPSEDTENMYEMAVKSALRSFSLSFTADRAKLTEEEVEELVREKDDPTNS